MKIKTSIISETIELEHNGQVAKSIPFTFDASQKWAEVNRYRFRMAENRDKPEMIGKLFLEMMQYVLGDAASELIEYYSGNWEGMIIDLAPLFIDVVYPACDDAHNRAINGLKRKKRSIFRKRNG